MLNQEAKDIISIFAMGFVPLGLIWSVMLLPQAVLEETNKPEKCWELQEIQGIVYKVNACTGETLILEQPTEQARNIEQPSNEKIHLTAKV